MKEKNSKIKAIVFDIGGVLQLGVKPRISQKEIHRSGVHERIAKKLGISIDQYFDSIDSAYAKSSEGKITKPELLSIFSRNLNYPIKKIEKLYFKSYKKVHRRNNGLFKIIKKLKKQRFKVGVLSDQWALSNEPVIPKKDRKLFDQVVISCEVGMRKPNPKIYKLILNRLKVKPSEAIFIDNQPWNLIPANKMGLNTILFVNNKKTKDQLKDFGVLI